MPRAIIVGHSGQDGRILWEQLVARGFSLIGISKRDVRAHGTRWEKAVNIGEPGDVHALLRGFAPDYIYYLAAHHHSSQAPKADESALWAASWAVHCESFLHFLNAIREDHPVARIFYAGSSRVFGQAEVSPQDETTPFRPICAYGVTKQIGMTIAAYHRRVHRVFASCGILFNHESPWRGPDFVSQRIVDGMVGLKMGRIKSLQLGNLDARVDWGYAPDYTRAMQAILEVEQPDDFVISSGETHSVRDMVEVASEILEIPWQGKVIENAAILKRGAQELYGDASKLRRMTGWQPQTPFRQMIEIMVRAALDRHKLVTS